MGQGNEKQQKQQKQPEKKLKDSTLELVERVELLEDTVLKILTKIDINDVPVSISKKRNYNPDYLPTNGGAPVTMADLPPKG